MTDCKEQHVCFKFRFKLWRRTTETSKTLKVPSGEQTVGRTQVFDWFSKFRSSVTSAEDAEHLEHISTSKTGVRAERVKEVLLKNRGMTLMKLLMYLVFHLCHFSEFWKAICMCLHLPPNLYPAC